MRPLLMLSIFMSFLLFFISPSFCVFAQEAGELADDVYEQYVDYFEKVYQTVADNYYKDIDRSGFDRFIEQFDTKIYANLRETGKSDDFIRWRSSALLVESLRDAEDVFSAFYPPKPAKEYEQTALGKRIDLGIVGEKKDLAYIVSHVEPRSDAYAKGLRENDWIMMIGEQSVADLEEKEVESLLNPLEGEKTKITYMAFSDRVEKIVDIETKEYFKQTVFLVPVKAPGVFCLQIRRFNRKTGEDLFRFLQHINAQGLVVGLIIDLRDNPGGPPLAAREMSSFFLPGGDDFAYFQRRGETRSMLDVPTIPKDFQFSKPLVILVNEESGSASELFSGVLQRRERAVLMGRNSAGQVMLKSMFHLDDESMVLLVTARGQHPDGHYFSFQGLMPDRYFPEEEEDEILDYASTYLYYIDRKGE